MAADGRAPSRLVTTLRSGSPREEGTLRVWSRFGPESGARALSLRILDLAPGPAPAWRSADRDELLFTLEGSGAARAGGRSFDLAPGSALHVPPGLPVSCDNAGPGPLTLASALCPATMGRPLREAVASRLGARRTEPAPDGRTFEVLLDEDATGAAVTLFVGSIPTGRAPDHAHGYEEALIVLEGRGRAWIGKAPAAVAAGSCIFLPAGQAHCMENLGDGPLRLLGVFHPSGSPIGSTRPAAG